MWKDRDDKWWKICLHETNCSRSVPDLGIFSFSYLLVAIVKARLKGPIWLLMCNIYSDFTGHSSYRLFCKSSRGLLSRRFVLMIYLWGLRIIIYHYMVICFLSVKKKENM